MTKIFSAFLMILIFSSCKVKVNSPEKIITGIDGLEMQKTRDFTTSEIQIARRVCRNLASKRDYFTSLDSMTAKFAFDWKYKDCSETSYTTATFNAYIVTPYLEYKANQDNYFADVVTDEEGKMKGLCDSVFRIEDVNRSENVKNTINFGSYTLTYNVLTQDKYDRVEIAKQVKNQQGEWRLAGIEAIDFISQASLTSQMGTKFLGVEKSRVRKINCDGNTFSSMTQTWTGSTNY